MNNGLSMLAGRTIHNEQIEVYLIEIKCLAENRTVRNIMNYFQSRHKNPLLVQDLYRSIL